MNVVLSSDLKYDSCHICRAVPVPERGAGADWLSHSSFFLFKTSKQKARGPKAPNRIRGLNQHKPASKC